MKIELNDETLTAYALGELDAAETMAVEKLLAEAARAGNDAPRKALEEIRAAATFAEEAFADAPETALTDVQREAVEAQADRRRTSTYSVARVFGMVTALAAGLLLLAILPPSLARSREGARRASAENDRKQMELAQQMQESLVSIQPGLEPELREKLPAIPYLADGALSGNLGGSAAVEPGRPESGGAGGDGTQNFNTQVNVSASTPPRTVDLQPVQVGGSLRVRGNWFSDGDVQQATEQLKALGYADGVDTRTENERRRQLLQLRQKERQQEFLASQQAFDAGLRFQPAPVTSPGAEAYAPIADAPFVRVADQPLSTFSIDVDTASYANVRRFLQQGQLPPPDAVRVEELINYFDYAYPAPVDGTPFSSHFEAVACPWAPQHTLVRIGLKGREVPRAERPASNLVFLIDVSGSMQPENKLPLVKRALAMLTRQLDERDRVAIVTYASGVNVALRPTNGGQQETILSAIDSLGANGSTNGAGGIQLAYESARRNFLPGGVNRVILATDGDFNVGISDNDSLLALIQQEAKSGVFLSVFGFGMGNLKDDKLELLADKGNGVYGYIDSDAEARKVFVEKLSGTLVTIAKDVKIQVEFNPSRVAAYRLVGYENRALAAQDFNDDRKDAGEIGAGHTVTALYEVVPTGMAVPAGSVDALRYQTPAQEAAAPVAASIAPPAHSDELLLVKLRYKEPEGAVSQLLEFPLKDEKAETMSADLKFASAVAAFGKSLRGNQLGAALSYDGMMQLAQAGLSGSDDPQRSEMIHLMLTARPLLEVRWEVPVAAAEIWLVNLRQVNGEWRARLQTRSRTSWFEVGEEFENYRLLAIVPETGCVVVFVERTQETITICLSAQ